MSNTMYLGIDLGTSGVKVMLAAARMIEEGDVEPQPRSGRQEMLENPVKRCLDGTPG